MSLLILSIGSQFNVLTFVSLHSVCLHSVSLQVRINNDLFVSHVSSVLKYYRAGSVVTLTCGVVILAAYLKSEYLQRQPFSSMMRMAVIHSASPDASSCCIVIHSPGPDDSAGLTL